MESIYDTTLPHRDGYYTVGLIDHLDPTHDHYLHTDSTESASLMVLNWIADTYIPEQIVVISPDGKRLRVSVSPIDWDAVEDGAYASDFITFS